MGKFVRIFHIVTNDTVRIFSDLHLGDRAGRVRTLAQLRPLFDDVTAVVLNGDCVDTRPAPVHLSAEGKAVVEADSAAQRARFLDFLHQHAPTTTLLTGNHDPDLSEKHFLELAGGQIFITHGDVLFDGIVPWSRDAPLLRACLARELYALSPEERAQLVPRLAAFRRVCAGSPKRHHAERRLLYYLTGLLLDTFLPPTRLLRIMRAWRRAPTYAANFMETHCPQAQFFLMGHTHRAAIAPLPGRPGSVLINTGAFCRPFVAYAVDVTASNLAVRRIIERKNAFYVGETLAEFVLAPAVETRKFTVSA